MITSAPCWLCGPAEVINQETLTLQLCFLCRANLCGNGQHQSCIHVSKSAGDSDQFAEKQDIGLKKRLQSDYTVII